MIFKKTRFDDGEQRLAYGMVSPGNWRFFHQHGKENPSPVGPQHPSEQSLLMHLEEYGREWGFDECFNKIYRVSIDTEGAILVCAANTTEAGKFVNQYLPASRRGHKKISRIGTADNTLARGVIADSRTCTRETVVAIRELLDDVAAALSTCLAHYGPHMPESDRVSRSNLVTLAEDMVQVFRNNPLTAPNVTDSSEQDS